MDDDAPSTHRVSRIRRPWTARRVARVGLFILGLIAGGVIAWVTSPHGDGAVLDVNLLRGVGFGVVLGLLFTQAIRDPDASRPPQSRLPKGFGQSLDELRRQLDEPEPRSEDAPDVA